MLGLAFDSISRHPGSIAWPSSLQVLYMANKPDPDMGFCYPHGSQVIILKDKYGETPMYLAHYEPHEDPNDFHTDSDLSDYYTGDGNWDC